MKNVVITGGSSGIGLAAAQHFYNKGYRVLIVARSVEKLATAEALLNQSEGSGEVHSVALDLSDFSAIANAVDQMTKFMPVIDVLVLNAGLFSGREYRMTKCGFETMIATTHMGHFQLTQLLLSQLKAS